MPGVEPVPDIAWDGFVRERRVPAVAIAQGRATSEEVIASDISIGGRVTAVGGA